MLIKQDSDYCLFRHVNVSGLPEIVLVDIF